MKASNVFRGFPLAVLNLSLLQRADAKLAGARLFEQGLTQLACEIEEVSGERVSECDCEFEVVDDATALFYEPILRNLTQRKFFKYFKVHLDRPCPFWEDRGQCARRECAIEECTITEVPAPWIQEDEQRRLWRCEHNDEVVDRRWLPAQGWSETGGDEIWIDQDSEEDEGMVYIDLLKNPEKFTGYDGEAAHRIWRAIHEENCFKEEEVKPKETFLNLYRRSFHDSECLERRVFYRLFSGLQSSISTHIAKSDFDDWRQIVNAAKDRRFSALLGVFLEDEGTLKNDPVFVSRVGAHKERLHNLYFAYLFVLRAVSRARDQLLAFDYDTGDSVDDAATGALVAQLVDVPADSSNCAAQARAAFDESVLFQPPDDPRMTDLERALARESVEELRAEFLTKFHNISRIMDCVTCERCRLWGKLQILGLGTALKILLMDGEHAGLGVLQRNEVVSLVNTLAQLAKSVDSVKDWQRRDRRRAVAKAAIFCAAFVFVAFVVCYLAARVVIVRLCAPKRHTPFTASINARPGETVTSGHAPRGKGRVYKEQQLKVKRGSDVDSTCQS